MNLVLSMIMALGLVLAACGNQQQGTKPFGYSFDKGSCSTGEHLFRSVANLCAALQDEAANNFCAQDLRREEFASRCTGQTFTPVVPEANAFDYELDEYDEQNQVYYYEE